MLGQTYNSDVGPRSMRNAYFEFRNDSPVFVYSPHGKDADVAGVLVDKSSVRIRISPGVKTHYLEFVPKGQVKPGLIMMNFIKPRNNAPNEYLGSGILGRRMQLSNVSALKKMTSEEKTRVLREASELVEQMAGTLSDIHWDSLSISGSENYSDGMKKFVGEMGIRF
ncbi:MAG: hypothetical protein V1648_02965 [Candidatus Aenigmatarchaeota archaeon]